METVVPESLEAMLHCLPTSKAAIQSKAALLPDPVVDLFISLSEAERIFFVPNIPKYNHDTLWCGSVLIHGAKIFNWPFSMEIPTFVSEIVCFLDLFHDDFFFKKFYYS